MRQWQTKLPSAPHRQYSSRNSSEIVVDWAHLPADIASLGIWLEQDFPSYVVNKWMRHTRKIAEKHYLQTVLELNQLLAAAGYMKERLRLLFQCLDRDRAERELTAWIYQAQSSGIKRLKDAAEKLLQWKPFILNWNNPPISTSKLEATNRKIGTPQRNACGYREEEYLKLRIYNIHTSTYALTG